MVMDIFLRNKGPLARANDTRQHLTKPASQNLSNNFIKGCTPCNGHVVLDVFSTVTLGNQGDHSVIEASIQLSILDKFHNSCSDILLDNLPTSFKEFCSKTIHIRAFSITNAFQCFLYLLLNNIPHQELSLLHSKLITSSHNVNIHMIQVTILFPHQIFIELNNLILNLMLTI
ncbi:unnamed protein product [Vicia faba]|uniref:Uncharacterized protein n=1 Tax=Vicia faba TaxID=3906 RepID=A0AAV1A449_VICFA|nr:unnamed protein product [Vicia faba]